MSRIIAVTVLAASLATSVSAHARVWTWSVDGVDANTGSGIAPFIRTPPNNNPVKDLTSTDVRCNVGGTTAVSAKFSAKAGSKLTPEWFHDNRGDDIIASSHVGPIVTYLAPAASNGEGAVWVKIAESG
jgi:cellulase